VEKVLIVNEVGIHSLLLTIEPEASGESPEFLAKRREDLKAFRKQFVRQMLPSIKIAGRYADVDDLFTKIYFPVSDKDTHQRLKENFKTLREIRSM
jgi:hypothetical protein